jgi:hypothetical protein
MAMLWGGKKKRYGAGRKMVTTAGHDQHAAAVHHSEAHQTANAANEHDMICKDVAEWHVCIRPGAHVIERWVCRDGKQWPPGEKQDPECIWPAWPTNLAEEKATADSPLAELEQRWDAATSRVRDSAKWLAAVLGAALAAVIPTAPLTDLGKNHLSVGAAIAGLLGLLSLSITMMLILQVLRPVSIDFVDIENAAAPTGLRARLCGWRRLPGWLRHAFEGPLYRWQQAVDRNPDLYLPCYVDSLGELRPLITIEQVTLTALALATEDADHEMRRRIDDARAARAARLYELRTAKAGIVAVGVYHAVRSHSTKATCLGGLTGFAGLVLVIASIAWP